MAGIFELAYQLLLGWMRTLFDFGWKLVSGQSDGSGLASFLTNWKTWLITILVIGLAADWLMWIVRWRPYRLLFGKFKRGQKDEGGEAVATWDDGTGYYDTEIPQAEGEPESWGDLTLGTLSEIDPDWENTLSTVDATQGMVDADLSYYDEALDVPPPVAAKAAQSTDGYWDETPDELDGQTAAYPAYPADMEQAADVPEAPEVYTYDESAGDTAVFPVKQVEEPADMEPTLQYGRPVMWPGQFAHLQADDEEASDTSGAYGEDETADYYAVEQPEESVAYAQPDEAIDQSAYMRPGDAHADDYDGWEPPPPRFSYLPDAQDGTRRRRSLRGTARDLPREEYPVEQVPVEPEVDNRPSRLVKPDRPSWEGSPAQGHEPRTVTGKPAKRRGLMRFADMQDEAIAGLPPLERPDAFVSEAEPYNPDFDDEDTGYYP